MMVVEAQSGTLAYFSPGALIPDTLVVSPKTKNFHAARSSITPITVIYR